MANESCAVCRGPLEPGYVVATNGSGLFWSKEASGRRLRPAGLEVLVPTGFEGTFSANLPGRRCPACKTISLRYG